MREGKQIRDAWDEAWTTTLDLAFAMTILAVLFMGLIYLFLPAAAAVMLMLANIGLVKLSAFFWVCGVWFVITLLLLFIQLWFED